MSLHIAVDVGGTHMRAASYASDHRNPVRFNRIHTRDEQATPLERLRILIASIWPENDSVAAIGVAAPGPLDPYKGVILAAPNIPGWVDLPLRKYLEDQFNVPVALGNDANLAAFGEWQFGAGHGHHHLIYLTVSTGIGGGVIVDDHLLLGKDGLAAELGHVTVLPNGPMCGCGHRGHLEAVASGTAIARWVQEELDNGAKSSLSGERTLTAKMIAAAAEQGDQLAISALERAGSFIGLTLASFLHIFNPSVVIIGGGVSLSGSFLLDPISTAIKENVITPHYLDGFTLTTAALGDEAGLMGALALARTLHP